MTSISDSSLIDKDRCDGVQKSHSAQFLPEESLSEDDDDMDHYENIAPQPKLTSKPPKGKSKVATRKSARKSMKTDYCEYSD